MGQYTQHTTIKSSQRKYPLYLSQHTDYVKMHKSIADSWVFQVKLLVKTFISHTAIKEYAAQGKKRKKVMNRKWLDLQCQLAWKIQCEYLGTTVYQVIAINKEKSYYIYY